jgi:hypothetical protein
MTNGSTNVKSLTSVFVINHAFLWYRRISFKLAALRSMSNDWLVRSPVISLVWFMVFNATFNNISVISWRSVLLVEETGVPGESHRPVASHWQTLSHKIVSSTSRHERGSNSKRAKCLHMDSWFETIITHSLSMITANMLAANVLDRDFEPRSEQTKDYNISISCCSVKHSPIKCKV